MSVSPLLNEFRDSSSLGQNLVERVDNIIIHTGSGYLAGYLFSIIDPIGGAVFGATEEAFRHLIRIAADQLGLFTSTTDKIIFFIGSKFAGLAIAAAVTTSIGFPLSIGGVIDLSLLMIPTSVISFVANRIFLDIAKMGLACLGGATLAIRDRLV